MGPSSLGLPQPLRRGRCGLGGVQAPQAAAQGCLGEVLARYAELTLGYELTYDKGSLLEDPVFSIGENSSLPSFVQCAVLNDLEHSGHDGNTALGS